MKRTVILRADGSERTGLGHLYRMVALAGMLAPDFDCHLAYRTGYPSVWSGNEDIQAAHALVEPSGMEAEELSKLALRLSPSTTAKDVIIVLDGYQYDLTYQALLKAEGFGLVFVDDIQHTSFVADLVINHAPSARLNNYSLAEYTNTAFGLRFALLRRVFLASAEQAPAPGMAPVFVCLGGADPDNLSVGVLRLLEGKMAGRPVNLVVGSAYLHKKALAEFLAGSSLTVIVHQGLSAKKMSALMWSSAFGITSPSTISLEYLATGKQLYLRQTADNQNDIMAALLNEGMAFPLEELPATAAYPLNPAVGKRYDGNQAVRIRKLFIGLGLNIRWAYYSDCRLLFRWATDPAVRLQSFNSEDIHWEEHKAWFVRQLVHPDRRFYVCEDSDGPVGLVRFSVEGEVALLGYSLCTRVRGKGYGVSMVHFATERLRAEVSAVRRVEAYVKKENMASRITLDRLGYTEFPTEDYPDALKFMLDV